MSDGPSDKEQVRRLADELDKLVDRARSEYDLSYASMVGVLAFKQHTLMQEAQERGVEE